MKQTRRTREAVGMRHAGALSALLLTAALMCAMPGLLRFSAGEDRAAESLRPAKVRTVTVWLVPGEVGDRTLLGECCAAFEKELAGARVFLRVVAPEEFDAENAVLPDVALFETGALSETEAFLPLADVQAPSGGSAGVQRAVPLWLAPHVLSIPQSWLETEKPLAERGRSLLAAATAPPAREAEATLAAAELPWGMLLRKGAVEKPDGVGYQQLLAACPVRERARLIAAVLQLQGEGARPEAEEQGWETTLPFSRSASPTPAPAVETPARVETLAQHQRRIHNGEALAAYALTPAVSDHVRYAALCRDGEEARAFVRFLRAAGQAALAHGLIPLERAARSQDPVTLALSALYEAPVLPNAFAHTRQELLQLCEDGFRRNEDPVRTLLGLR